MSTTPFGPDKEVPEKRRGSVSDGEITCFFHDIEAALLECIRDCDAVVGCVAWFTNPVILTALLGKPTSIIVQNEPFLRKGLKATNEPLRALYGELSGYSRYEPIRCHGSGKKRKRAEIRPLMHHKFLVFLRQDTPFTVWTGSYNISKNSTKSIENAVLLRNEVIALAYFNQWESVYKTSWKLP